MRETFTACALALGLFCGGTAAVLPTGAAPEAAGAELQNGVAAAVERPERSERPGEPSLERIAGRLVGGGVVIAFFAGVITLAVFFLRSTRRDRPPGTGGGQAPGSPDERGPRPPTPSR